ncbi:glucan endo-1,3-beta-glucosidase 14 [Rosa sericea]
MAGFTNTVLFRIILVLVSLSDSALFHVQCLSFGINYGQIANNLPPPSQVAGLLQSLNVSRVKLYDADPNVLQAFSNSEVDFIIALGNELLPNMTDPLKAQTWIQQHVTPHLPQTKISSILVGNEILGGTDTLLMSYLLTAMQSVYAALVNLGLSKTIAVTTANSLAILGNSYPPSAGTFREDLAQYIKPILDFHSQTNAPFLINVYPYFAYKASPGEVSLEYVLFQPNSGMNDSGTNLHYDNMLDAQMDAVYAAMKVMGHTDIEVRISETGWPSKGDENEAGATPENAGIYNGNLLRKIVEKKGTPAKPDVPIDTYVFALFNEDLKPGPASERNYGLFYPNGTRVYDIGDVGAAGTDGADGYLPQFTFSSAHDINALSIFNFLIFLIVYLLWE